MNTVCVLLSGLSVYFNVQVHTRTHTNRATHCTPNDVNVGKCAASSLTPHQSSQRPRAIKVNRLFRGVNGLLIGALTSHPKSPELITIIRGQAACTIRLLCPAQETFDLT